jgi:hypothetical protein
MRRILMISYLCFAAVGCAGPRGESLSNDLSKWSSRGTAEWRVQDGVLLGGQNGDPKRSGLLYTKQVYQDFDLKLEFMIDEHGKYNSGVYFRYDPTLRKRFYQLNIGRGAAKEYTGLYLDRWLDKGDEQDTIRKKLAWNHLRIRAVGPHIEAWLNEKKIVNYTDPTPEPYLLRTGHIGLQTYGAEGHAGWVKFKNVTVRDLSPTQ